MSNTWIKVITTLPQSPGPDSRLEGHENQPRFRTERLLMRPLRQSDLEAFHRLRSQPEFMKYTRNSIPDNNLRETQEKLDDLINAPQSPDAFPFYTYFGIFLKATGELIGDGGVHARASPACGWPEVGCKLGREHWRGGYGTEFLRAFVAWWWDLPRHKADGREQPVPMKILVHPDSVIWDWKSRSREGEEEEDTAVSHNTDARGQAIEQLYAWIATDNYACQRMVIKTGFEHFVTWEHHVKKVLVMGWRHTRSPRTAYPSKL